jgi:hypothetical protein
MADDHSQRPYRSNETIARSGQARSAAPASASNDPLAELARLIGQTDPFGDLGKEPRRAPAAAEPAMEWAAPSAQAYAQQAAPSVAPDYPPQPPQPAQRYAEPSSADLYEVDHQEVPSYLTQPRAQGYAQRGYEPEAGQEDYDDIPAPRRRIGVMAIAGIFALAVVGTAGAFGYRAVFGGTGTRMPPPVIKADTAPSKIVPDSAAKDSSKLITERVGGPSGEKIVSREEKPVDIKDKIATPVFPPVTVAGNTGAGNTTGNNTGNGVVAGEPRKVHTITIRPDQPMVADATASAPAPRQPAPVAMAEPQQARAAAPPLAPARPQQQVSAPAPRPAPAPMQAAPRVAAPAPAHSANAPLSLNPDAGPGPAPAPRAPTRTANAAPTSLAPAPSANPASAARGGYAVQVTSQRSEAEAQSAYRALQGKYGSVLGGRSMFVHKVELGAKGTYYRAMVGPFGSQSEAAQLCASLKSAGGSCLIQRN